MNVLKKLTHKNKIKMLNMMINILSIFFIMFILFYLWDIVLPITACHVDGFRELLGIDNMYCHGESYHVGIGLFQVYGLLVLAGITILLGVKFIVKKWSK